MFIGWILKSSLKYWYDAVFLWQSIKKKNTSKQEMSTYLRFIVSRMKERVSLGWELCSDPAALHRIIVAVPLWLCRKEGYQREVFISPVTSTVCVFTHASQALRSPGYGTGLWLLWHGTFQVWDTPNLMGCGSPLCTFVVPTWNIPTCCIF